MVNVLQVVLEGNKIFLLFKMCLIKVNSELGYKLWMKDFVLKQRYFKIEEFGVRIEQEILQMVSRFQIIEREEGVRLDQNGEYCFCYMEQ